MTKKTIIITLIAILAVVGFGIGIKAAQKNESPYAKQGETGNSASELGEGEVRLTDENFKTEIVDYKGIALVDFYSPTCPYCQKVGPVISEIAKETKGKYKVGKLDVTKNYETVATLNNFKSVPLLVFYKDGKEVDRLQGFQDKETILNKLQEIK